MSPVELTVEGQRFRVTERSRQPGTYDFVWLNGSYGFSAASTGQLQMSRQEMIDLIRGFLSGPPEEVDPVES